MTRPGPLRYIAYSFGRTLPDSMREWVRNDLTGEHAILRHLLRSMVPFLPVFVGIFVFLPGPVALRTGAVALGVILALIYSFAFMDLNRSRRLSQHGLPEGLESTRQARRREQARAAYERAYRHR
jgi:hypothetical protein